MMVTLSDKFEEAVCVRNPELDWVFRKDIEKAIDETLKRIKRLGINNYQSCNFITFYSIFRQYFGDALLGSTDGGLDVQ